MEIVTDNLLNQMEENNKSTLQQNVTVLAAELEWLSKVINLRVALHFAHETTDRAIEDLPVPDLSTCTGTYATFIRKHHLNTAERLVLILALTPRLKPGLLDILSTKNPDYDRRHSECGGLFLEGHSGLIPTAETALFILAGDEVSTRIGYQHLFHPDHVLSKMHVIPQNIRKKGAPRFSGVWMVTHEYADYLICGYPYEATYSEDFPAQRITTQMEWEDIILSKHTANSLQEIRNWATYGQVVMRDLGLGTRLKPGYKSLFYGPPGTGKTMTAALLGKSTNKPVYKVDLSMVVSKYIGETEKNLAKVFDQAASQDWILFFDEADSLFGHRTQVSTANDRYGNQEIGYLLQRIEDFPGVVILASNLKDNIDEAFTRRFQSMVEFRMPGVEERYRLWEQSFSEQLPIDPGIDLWAIAEKYQLSGGVMMNVVRKSTLLAVTQQQVTITQKELEDAIRQELQKEGILLS
ncbi:MAG: ATP-binding protein [Bacteroidota bacterium]